MGEIERKYIPFNLYYYIKVKLNEKGETILKEVYGEEGFPLMKERWFDGEYYEFQLFTFAYIFGQYPIWDKNSPVDANILLEIPVED